jgi:hypothetical protein
MALYGLNHQCRRTIKRSDFRRRSDADGGLRCNAVGGLRCVNPRAANP